MISNLVMLSPSMVLASVSLFAFGWSFVVRWGLTGVPFLLLTAVYCVLQVPAYIQAFLLGAQPGAKQVDLSFVFVILAFLKLAVGVYSFAFFFSVSDQAPEMHSQKYWPLRNYVAPLDPVARRILLHFLFGVVTLFLGAITGARSDWVGAILKMLGSLIHGPAT